MSNIVSRQVLAKTADWMTSLGRSVTIQEVADHFNVGYNRGAEITRYGTRHEWFRQSYRHGKSHYYPTGVRPETPGDTRQEIAEVPVTFGVEAEMDFLIKNIDDPEDPIDGCSFVASGGGGRGERSIPDETAATRGWGARADVTVGAEVASPVWDDIGLAASSMQRQWEHWISMNREDEREIVPYFVGENRDGHRSIGMHIHLGTHGRPLSREEKRKIANVSIMEYPLVIAICANSPTERYSSHRIGFINVHDDTGSYARPMDLFGETITSPAHGCGDRNHYFEISDSALHGTIEFRAQDATIPQAVLASAWLLQKLGARALQEQSYRRTQDGVDLQEYRERRDRAVSPEGPSLTDVQEYVDELVQKIGDLSLDDIPTSVKEILFLALKKRVLPVHIYHRLFADIGKRYEYFEKLSVRPTAFFSPLSETEPIAGDERIKSVIMKWAMECRSAHKLSDLKPTTEQAEGPAALDPIQVIQQRQAEAQREIDRINARRHADQRWLEIEDDRGNITSIIPQDGWFRIRDLSSRQTSIFETYLNPDQDEQALLSGNEIPGMSALQARQNVDRFHVHVADGDVDDFVVQVMPDRPAPMLDDNGNPLQIVRARARE